MSATLAVILKELHSNLKIAIYEKLESPAQESSNAWNNAGTARRRGCPVGRGSQERQQEKLAHGHPDQEFMKQQHAQAHEAGMQAMDQGHEQALTQQQQSADSMAQAADQATHGGFGEHAITGR